MADIFGRVAELSAEKRELLERLVREEGTDFPTSLMLPRAASASGVPLSFAQERLWFLDQLLPSRPVYNTSASVRISGKLNHHALERTLNEIVRRHEALRTTFQVVDDQPVQIITPPTETPLDVVDLQGLSPELREPRALKLASDEARRPFDLEAGPLFRSTLIRLDADEHILLLTMHLIVSDGWSIGILTHEMSTLYEAFSNDKPSPLPELNIQYADFALWQRQWLQGDALQSQLSYWKQQLDGAPPVLELPSDRPRPPVPTFEGATAPFVLSKELSDSIEELSRQEGLTLFMTLLAAFDTLLLRYSGQSDVVVGSPIANRNRSEIEGLIGFFTNTLALRTDLSGNPTFRELMARVRDVALDAFAHQDLPFERLVEEIQPDRDLSRTPLVQVMFALQNAPVSNLELTSLTLAPMKLTTGVATFDMTIQVWETDEALAGSFEYNTDLFDGTTISRMTGHLETLLQGIVNDPDQKLSDLPLLTDSEKQQILVEWNDTKTEYPSDKCIHQLFEQQVARSPDAIAIVYDDQQLSYGELNRRANQLAHYLRTLGVGPEVPVGVCMERSIDVVVAILGTLKAGGAYVPLDPQYPKERLDFMIRDARIQTVLTIERLADGLPATKTTVKRVDSDEELGDHERTNPVQSASCDNLAYIIHTSGSTGQPKGVAVTHQNLVHSTTARFTYYSGTPTSFLLLSPFTFDSSVAGMFWTLCTGGTLVIPKERFESEPSALAELIARYRITHLLSVPPLYGAILTHALSEIRPPVLESLRAPIVAGEACPVDLVDRHYEFNTKATLFNEYGPTEATVWCCAYRCSPIHDRSTVPIGRPISNTQIHILDDRLLPVPSGVQGELHIAGVGLARGYLNRPDQTAEKFIPNPFSQEPGSRLYDTGDIARYLPDGNIEFLGRADQQVKIRGYRIELGEVEAAIGQHPAAQEVVALAREDDPLDKRLVAYLVSDRFGPLPTITELRGYLQQKLPEYMIPSHFVMLEALPLTPNGKIDRKALPPPDETRPDLREGYLAPRSPIEEILAEIWRSILHLAEVGVHDNFFELGGHSLLATQVASRIQAVLKTELPLRALFETPTIAELASSVEGVWREGEDLVLPTIVKQRRPVSLPLSFAQERLWFLDQLLPGRSVYNVPASIRISGKLNHHALERTLNEIVRRHEALRTTFQVVDDQPVQIITPPTETPLDVVDLQGLSPELRESRALKLASDEARRPFDLEAGPLLRSTLIRLDADEHILLLTMHHIVSDGWSIGILTHEMSTLYEAFSNDKPSPLPELNIQYADFALWQRQWLQGDVLQSQLSYWKQQLDGAPPVLELPSDRPRPPVESFEGATAPFVLSKELPDSIEELSRQEGLTLFMTLLAAFDTLLLRYSGQSDVVVGSPIANRNRSEIEGLIGFFVNTLALRTDLSGNPTFRELMARVRDVALDAFAHQDLPFERLVEEIQPDRQLSHSPLIQVGLALHNTPRHKERPTAFDLSELDVPTSKFDLTLHAWETDTGLSGLWEYNTDLFDGTTISRMTGHLETLLQGIVNDPDQKLSDLPLLTDSEKQQILVEWNDTKTEYPSDKCIHQLFEQQVARSPDAIAIVYDDQQLSYGELNRRANQLAHYLRTLGVGPEVPVGVCMERSIDVVVAILGTLKAGGAYVPLDPQYPKERLDFMIRDARIQTVLTLERLADGLSGRDIDLVAMDTEWDKISRLTPQTSVSSAVPANLAYIIYTSGSTGRPKGVLIAHRGVSNLSRFRSQALDTSSDTRVLQFASLSFDGSIWEILSTLMAGATLVLPPSESPSSTTNLEGLLYNQSVSTAALPPSILAFIDPSSLDGLHTLVSVGERCSADLDSRLSVVRHFYNGYGPTEITIVACLGKSRGTRGRPPPIGWPISNTQIHILDDRLLPVPSGVQGELHIAGVGLARGYLNRPDQTAEKFIPNPFSQDPGARLYKSGDIARYLPDGNIEFLGRADQQVKIRGYRIELGEVEAAIGQHPAVQEVVALAREDDPLDRRLVAYVVPHSTAQDRSIRQPSGGLHGDYVSRWQVVFEETYGQRPNHQATDFDTTGWNSSYDGLPIPEEQMREWTDATVERILSLKPDRVLEIGCGTGLILLRVAPHCAQYVGTDFSEAALDNLRQLLDDPALHLSHVSTLHRTADDFEGIEAGSFDTVVINSVAQYFPDIDYLSRVIEGTINALRPGGSIFLGDVRSLPLLEALHTSIQLHRPPPSMPIDILNQRIQKGIEQEEELVVDPSFFSSLKLKLPQIKHVHVQPKRGSFLNELNLFRYDVVLRVGVDPTPHMDQTWIDWRTDNLTLDTLLRTLSDDGPETLGIRSVPNARLSSETRAMTVLNGDIPPEHDTVGDLRQAVENDTDESGIDPEDIWALGQRLPYVVDISWASSRPDGSFDVLFRKRSTSPVDNTPSFLEDTPGPKATLANNPLKGAETRTFVPQLRAFLKEKLPEYMIPSHFTILDTLPLTAHGKVDRQALPSPDETRPDLEQSFVAPSTPVETALAEIWAQALNINRVGIHDNFFDLGGHSLSATQVISRVRSTLNIDLPLQNLFQEPTVSSFAEQIRRREQTPGRIDATLRLGRRIQLMTEDQIGEAVRQYNKRT